MGDLEIRDNVLTVNRNLTWEYEAEFDSMVARLLESDSKDLALDLSAAAFIASPFVARIVRLHEAAAKRGGALKLLVSKRLVEFFETAGLIEALNVEVVEP